MKIGNWSRRRKDTLVLFSKINSFSTSVDRKNHQRNDHFIWIIHFIKVVHEILTVWSPKLDLHNVTSWHSNIHGKKIISQGPTPRWRTTSKCQPLGEGNAVFLGVSCLIRCPIPMVSLKHHGTQHTYVRERCWGWEIVGGCGGGWRQRIWTGNNINTASLYEILKKN